MSVHISDSAIYQNAWGTRETRALFEEKAVVAGWIEIMAILAEIQAEFGLIPAGAAEAIGSVCRKLEPDADLLEEARNDFELTNHSLLGLIKALQRRCPGESGEWLCYGATVQDITDTQTARAIARVHKILQTNLCDIAVRLIALARTYRHTPMCGRTHGQPGLPITFGFKAAGWLDEVLRHLQRFQEIESRLIVGQLAGGVGSLSSLGAEALALQQRFLARLNLSVPAISWTSSRDRIAEWLNLLTMTTATADRIGHEIYNLQRPEIGELSEGFVSGTVGSITMPQKRNPEISEHLGTLARLVRYRSAHMQENLVHDHERDGRSWKSEWEILPVASLASAKVLALLEILLTNLVVHDDRMLANLEATQGFVQAERVMLALAPHIGKQSAHQLVYKVTMAALESGQSLELVVLDSPEIKRLISPAEINDLFDYRNSIGQCAEMVDRVLATVEAILPTFGGG